MTTIPRTSGIYQILCVPTGKVYIGSAVNLYQRWIVHRHSLRHERHHNAYLQNAWNKYGEDVFTFTVIEFVSPPTLLEREQFWIDETRCCDKDIGFNLYKIAGSPYGMIHSDEARQRMSEQRTGRKLPPFTEEHRAKLSEAKRGVPAPYSDQARLSRSLSQKGKAPSENTRLAQIEAESHHFIVTDPDGNTYTIKNLSRFCREHGLDKATAHRVAQGKAPQHKGWRFSPAHNENAIPD